MKSFYFLGWLHPIKLSQSFFLLFIITSFRVPLTNSVRYGVDRSLNWEIFKEFIKIYVTLCLLEKNANLIFQSDWFGYSTFSDNSDYGLFEMVFQKIWLKKLSANEFCFDEDFTVFGTPEVYIFNLLQNGWGDHEIVGEFADLAPFNHSFVELINRGIIFWLKFVENFLNILPFDLLADHTSMLNIEDDFFNRNSSIDFRIFNGCFIDECTIAVVIFDFVYERFEMDGFISKGIKGREYIFKIFPALLTQNAFFHHIKLFLLIIPSDIGSINVEQVEELCLAERILAFMRWFF